jgi:hypothetical protein
VAPRPTGSPPSAANLGGPALARSPIVPAGSLVAEIAGVTTVVKPGGRATLQARATPGARCDLAVEYAGGSGGPVGSQQAGADGLCTFNWTVPANAGGGWGSATLLVIQGQQRQTRRVGFTVG